MALAAPSMVHRAGDTLVVRSVVSGDALFGTSDNIDPEDEKVDVTLTPAPASSSGNPDEDADLPQCKIKRNYACSKCSYYTQNPRFYLYHLKNVHKEKIKVYECPSCLYASKHSQKLQRHVHMVHVMGAGRRKTPPKPKPIAPKTTPRPYTRRRQNLSSVESPKEKEETKELVDSTIDLPLCTGEGDSKVFKCSLCPFNSRSQTLVTRHERVVHLKKKFFRCIKCNYVTHMKARYTKHVKYHSMPMIKCEMCDFRTPYKWNLDRHNKNHQGDGAFKCSLCNFTADIKQSLTVHEMNHHVPPVGQAVPSKRRNRVGASDTLSIDQGQPKEPEHGQEDMDVVSVEHENEQVPNLTDVVNDTNSLKGPITSDDSLSPRSKSMMKKPKTFASFNSKELTVKLGEKVINPNDMLQHKNGNVYLKRLKCRICNYRAAWESEMARHEARVHNLGEKKKQPPRPIPNLIPIQNKVPGAVGGGQAILKIPSIKGGPPEIKSGIKPDNIMSEKDLNDICAKSCPNSSLKDFASLIGGADAFKTKENDISLSFTSGSSAFPVEKRYENESSLSPVDFRKNSDVFKKKNASFFDKLKEKLMTGVNENTGSNLVCTWCGHESKCLSEANRHQKIHSGKGNGNTSVTNGNPLISGAELSSTRCQHCRQRCKTSADLFVHLQSCIEANKKASEYIQDQEQKNLKHEKQDNIPSEIPLHDDRNSSPVESKMVPHPMENKVFVWNNLPERNNNENESNAISENSVHNSSFTSVVRTPPRSETQSNNINGSENSLGYGTITSKNKSGSQGHNIPPPPKEEKKNVDHSLKKVYKCPHCSFWASTASRFHVHIVGHLNKKPFECSLCAYRSNWRWDITKHIRLKTVRDASHERARVLMTDETGRRNYSKYNKYLTLMRVHEPSAESSGSGRRTKSQPDSSVSAEYSQQEQHSSSPPPSSLPAPPKLTPAPTAMHSNNMSLHSSSTMQMQPPPPLSQLRPLYPKPPPLQSAIDIKRSHEANSSEEPLKKKPNLDNKKTMWKCKKCFFRDSDKSVVLAHVKEHYGNQNGGVSKSEVKSNVEESNFTKQNGEYKGTQQNDRESQNSYESQTHKDNAINNNSNEHLKCPTCTYMGQSENDLAEHIYQNHGEETSDDLFKCFFCPFYVSDKQKLIDHMNLHGMQESEGYTSKGGRVSPKKNYAESGDTSPTKRYKCSGCPYVSNSKSQFLYHKQFHRPRGAPFKCTMCSYNVTRRHLLHQHLRVHGIHVPTQKIKESGYEDIDDTMDAPIDIGPLDTSNLPEIPLVWVSKLGNLTKMFKCRYCPHVNIRKSNIQEHEKMHGQRTKPGIDGDSSPSHQQQHHCPDCNYVCNNAGVLSSHAKVHQGLFGQVCSLVDNTRSDEAQIKELNALLGRNEEGPPVITPDEIKKESKHSSEFNLHQIEDVQEHVVPDGDKLLRFCNICPARFLFQKELDIHLRFHSLNLSHRCESCSYTARQRPHLLAHYKVHTDEYQDRTTTLCKMYEISPDYPKPKIAVIVDGPGDVGPAWVVVPPPEYPRTPEELDETLTSSSNMEEESLIVTQHGNRLVHKQFSCHRCPAQFFKSVALQYHLTLHGGPGRHKCRSCDYAVKTYGNLIKHEAVHEQLEPRVKPKPKTRKNEIAVPTSGTELFRQKTEAAQKVAATPPPPPPPPAPLHIDPEFGLLMHGSPEFIYPTYLKNGRLKEKRYKCHKCPSAFEKREQYKVHLSLHGSKQRYNCERCDYSVKYYANYIQHLRKHQSNDATKAERKLSTDKSSDEHGSEDVSESTDAASEDVQIPPAIIAIASQRSAKSLQMSMADQQTMMLLQQRVVGNSVSPPETINRCPYCPYSNQRRDGVGSHVKCHSNGKTGAFTCRHCNYTVPQQHFLREHNKLHFAPIKGMRPEAYMKCDRLELWSEPANTDQPLSSEIKSNNKILIFKDKGGNYKSERFLPQLPQNITTVNESDSAEKIYINLKTGEIESDQDATEDTKEDNKENLEVISKDENEIGTVKQEQGVENNNNIKSNDNESVASGNSNCKSDEEGDDDDGGPNENETKCLNDGIEDVNNMDDVEDNNYNEDGCNEDKDNIVNQSEEEPLKSDNSFDYMKNEGDQMETEQNHSNKDEGRSCDSECSTSCSSANSGSETEDDSNGSSSCSTTED